MTRAEEAEAKNKKLEQELLSREQEIQSLNHRLSNAEAQLDASEGKLTEAKQVRDEHESSKTTNEGLQRKIQLLEEELDNAEKNLKETVDKCVHTADYTSLPLINRFTRGASIQAPSDGSEGRALRTPGSHPGGGEGPMGEEIRSTANDSTLVPSSHIVHL